MQYGRMKRLLSEIHAFITSPAHFPLLVFVPALTYFLLHATLASLTRHHIRRRAFIALLIFTSVFLLYRESTLFSSSPSRPQVSDRKILESEQQSNVPAVAVPPVAALRPSQNMEQFGNDEEPIAVILVMAAKRERAIKNHLEQLIKLRPSAVQFPIVISQDGTRMAVTQAISDYISEDKKISFIHHKQQADPPFGLSSASNNYFHIANHYKWALDKIFLELKYKTAIITEDDLDLANDFFSYFTALKPILLNDKTVWCISAWNDNGGANITDRNHGEKLYRTDFFPGLGWMLTAELWAELSINWPTIYWDDWMRRQDVRKGRVCIRPEVSRTSHNNKVAGKGTSGGLYKKYLASVRLPETAVDFEKLDLSYLIKNNYDRLLEQELLRSRILLVDDFLDRKFSTSGPFIILYDTPREYRRLGKSVGLMLDIRSGMPRTAYYGIITFMDDLNRFYLVPKNLSLSNLDQGFLLHKYNENWDKMTRYLEFQETYCKPTKYTGKCDPEDPDLIAWFVKRRMTKRLKQWGEMIIN